MILLSLLALITLRPITASQKSNVLSGITGNCLFLPCVIYLSFVSHDIRYLWASIICAELYQLFIQFS
jgi:hypothetical protein